MGEAHLQLPAAGRRQPRRRSGSESGRSLEAYQNSDDPARFAPWLYRIANNEAYSLFRKRRPEGAGGNAVFPMN